MSIILIDNSILSKDWACSIENTIYLKAHQSGVKDIKDFLDFHRRSDEQLVKKTYIFILSWKISYLDVQFFTLMDKFSNSLTFSHEDPRFRSEM